LKSSYVSKGRSEVPGDVKGMMLENGSCLLYEKLMTVYNM